MVSATSSKYELLRYIASGGMADVFLARSAGIGGFEKLVVTKRIRQELAKSSGFRSMFLEEARLAAVLHHPNIIQVYDVAEMNGTLFAVMEFLHGQDVHAIAARASERGVELPLSFAVGVVLAVSSGLHCAHDAVGPQGETLGIVHRDVSPHNVFVTYDGGVKLIDFGIAKARVGMADETGSGVMKGKPGYLSPEQCLGEPIDRRTDVFCTGILLYELATNRRLFPGDGGFMHLKRIVETKVPPPSAVDSDFPEELERVILRALAREREDRYATARELQCELERAAQHLGLDVSSYAIARTVRELFDKELAIWDELARSGVPVEDRVGTPIPRPELPETPGEDDRSFVRQLSEAQAPTDGATLVSAAPAVATAEPTTVSATIVATPRTRNRSRARGLLVALGIVGVVLPLVWLVGFRSNTASHPSTDGADMPDAGTVSETTQGSPATAIGSGGPVAPPNVTPSVIVSETAPEVASEPGSRNRAASAARQPSPRASPRGAPVRGTQHSKGTQPPSTAQERADPDGFLPR